MLVELWGSEVDKDLNFYTADDIGNICHRIHNVDLPLLVFRGGSLHVSESTRGKASHGKPNKPFLLQTLLLTD